MAEGHAIHRAVRDQRALLVGGPVGVASPQGRFAREAARLDGRVLEGVEPWGKHLFYAFAGGLVVHVHLGLAGAIARVSSPDVPPRKQARLRLANARAAFDMFAPSVCELGDRVRRDDVVARLGPDPLRDDADPERVFSALAAQRGPIGAALLDQSLVSGVGNVLRAEALHLVGVHPDRPARALDRATFDALWGTLVAIMRQAVDDGRIITRVPAGVARADVREAEGRWVYKQARCRACGAPVEVWPQKGRTAYACPRCQPREPATARRALARPSCPSPEILAPTPGPRRRSRRRSEAS